MVLGCSRWRRCSSRSSWFGVWACRAAPSLRIRRRRPVRAGAARGHSRRSCGCAGRRSARRPRPASTAISGAPTTRPCDLAAHDDANANDEDPRRPRRFGRCTVRRATPRRSRRVRVAPAAPGLAERDRYAILRFGACPRSPSAAAIAAGPEIYGSIWGGLRLARRRGRRRGGQGGQIDAWIDPPHYTGQPPILLRQLATSGARWHRETMTVFEGSTLVLRGEPGVVETRIEVSGGQPVPTEGRRLRPRVHRRNAAGRSKSNGRADARPARGFDFVLRRPSASRDARRPSPRSS